MSSHIPYFIFAYSNYIFDYFSTFSLYIYIYHIIYIILIILLIIFIIVRYHILHVCMCVLYFILIWYFFTFLIVTFFLNRKNFILFPPIFYSVYIHTNPCIFSLCSYIFSHILIMFFHIMNFLSIFVYIYTFSHSPYIEIDSYIFSLHSYMLICFSYVLKDPHVLR